MKIALYNNLPPGGAERYMREVVLRSAETHDYTEFAPHVVERDWALRPATTAIAVGRAERRIAAEINAGGYDLAFVHGCRVMQAPGVLRHLTIPSVYMCQEPRRRSFEPGYRPGAKQRDGVAAIAWRAGSATYDWILGRRDRAAVHAATALACNSAFSAEYIARAYGRDATVCYAGVDLDLFRPLGCGASPRSHYLAVGAIDATKGHDVAIDAVACLPEAERRPLVIVGPRTSGETAAQLVRRAASSGVDLDIRHGVSDRGLADLYRDAAVTLAAARLEPFGLTVLESVASGTPVVAVREGGYRETVEDGVNGALVERDPRAFADGILRVIELGRDAAALHVSASRWSWDATVKRLHEVFDGLVVGR